MKKIYQFFKKINTWLASFGVDRYLHLLAGLFISFISCIIFHYCAGESMWTCVAVAMIITSGIGMGKEVADQTFESTSDGLDFAFTCLGGIIGCALWLL